MMVLRSKVEREIHRGEQENAEASQRFNRKDAKAQRDAKKFFNLIPLWDRLNREDL